MHVADKVARHIVYHDALVERVESKEAILPALLLAANVVGVEAVEFKDWSCVLAGRDGEGGRAHAVDCGCHCWNMLRSLCIGHDWHMVSSEGRRCRIVDWMVEDDASRVGSRQREFPRAHVVTLPLHDKHIRHSYRLHVYM